MSDPSHRAYSVITREGREDFWHNTGLVFPHGDGEGFSILLEMLPLDGKIVLRRYKEGEPEEAQQKKGKQYVKK